MWHRAGPGGPRAGLGIRESTGNPGVPPSNNSLPRASQAKDVAVLCFDSCARKESQQREIKRKRSPQKKEKRLKKRRLKTSASRCSCSSSSSSSSGSTRSLCLLGSEGWGTTGGDVTPTSVTAASQPPHATRMHAFPSPALHTHPDSSLHPTQGR